MPLISPPLPADGEDIDAADVNDPINAILALINGALDEDNLADEAVILSKLADSVAQSLVPIGSILPYGGASAPNASWLLCYGQAISRSTYSALYAIVGTSYGVGDGSTTFNLPDLRGRIPVGNDAMGGTAANRTQRSSTLTTTSGSPTATVGSATNLSVGMYVESTNVADGTTITVISGTTLTLSANATGSGTTVAARFSLYHDAQELGQTGGADVHTSTEAQMPSHIHNQTAYGISQANGGGSGLYGMSNNPNQGTVAQTTLATGGSQPHPNLQPGQVTNFIIKT